MTIAIKSPPQHLVLDDVSWEYYTQTLYELDGRHLRITYDRGRMEIMTVGGTHERVKKIVARLLETYSLETDIPVTGSGNITCRRKDLRQGLEPDECYYIQTQPPPITDGELDLTVYPPPDLAIEVDVTRSSIPRQPIYANLGVPEVWRFGEEVIFLHRQADGTYKPSEGSLNLPALLATDLNRFVQLALTTNQHEAAKALRDWARSGA